MALYAVGALTGLGATWGIGIVSRSVTGKMFQSFSMQNREFAKELISCALSDTIGYFIENNSPFWKGASLGARVAGGAFAFGAGMVTSLIHVPRPRSAQILYPAGFRAELNKRVSFHAVVPLVAEVLLKKQLYLGKRMICYFSGINFVYQISTVIATRRIRGIHMA